MERLLHQVKTPLTGCSHTSYSLVVDNKRTFIHIKKDTTVGIKGRISGKLIISHIALNMAVPLQDDVMESQFYKESSDAAPLSGNNKGENRCMECNKVFSTQFTLRNHLMKHSNNRPFACSQCDKSFVLETTLEAHIKTVHSKQTFECKECGKHLKSKHYLKIHLLIHKEKKDFGCLLCAKSFVDANSLKKHLKEQHVGERRYECKHCNKTFKQASHLRTHERLHTQELPFKCDLCSNAFRQVSNLILHKKRHHSWTLAMAIWSCVFFLNWTFTNGYSGLDNNKQH